MIGVFVVNFCICFVCDEVMQKIGWDLQLMIVFKGQFFVDLLVIGWVVFVDIDGDIEKFVVIVVYQFVLCMGWGLEMQFV